MKKSQIKLLDTLWSKKVKDRADHKCEYCLEREVWLNSAHIIGRSYRTLRWDLDNGMCLCFNCHRAYDQHLPLAEQIRKVVIGEKRLKRLLKKKQIICKYQDFEKIKKTLEAKLLKANNDQDF